jgi:hypothetical protein
LREYKVLENLKVRLWADVAGVALNRNNGNFLYMGN